MPCFRPIKGYRSRERGTVHPEDGHTIDLRFSGAPLGRRSFVAGANRGFYDRHVTVPCGQCIGCRLERSRQWAIRCSHEAQCWERNCFITLTYSPENLPAFGSLVFKHFQDFMKRLRKKYGDGIRFFHCGEYGEKFARPHYHACLFNFDFEDREFYKLQRDGLPLFTSKCLSELWGKGFCLVGDVTFESAAYVARYITKKLTGERRSEYESAIDWVSGEVYERAPEYVTMSRRPGIGAPWLEEFKSDVYPGDFVVIRNKRMRVPKFYDRCFELDDPEMFRSVKSQRRIDAAALAQREPESRLAVREECQYLRFVRLKRGYENGEE